MSERKATPRGQMTRGANSGPAIMMMPPHIRATFMPNPPLVQVLPPTKRRKTQWTGVFSYANSSFERTVPPPRVLGTTPQQRKEAAIQRREEERKAELEPKIRAYRQEQRASAGEFEGMNCYNTLFVGRLAYEVTERKLLREFEVFGPVKDLKVIQDRQPQNSILASIHAKDPNAHRHPNHKSRGYAFIEFEREDDMKRAYRAADGMKLEGRAIVADVERGHTVPNWLPRRLGGGLGGTRLGGKNENVLAPGRFDPASRRNGPDRMGPSPHLMGMGRGNGGMMIPPPHHHHPAPTSVAGPPPSGFGRGGPQPLPPVPNHGPSPYGNSGFGRGRGGSGGGSGGGGYPSLPPLPRGGGGGGQWERLGPPSNMRYNDRNMNSGPPGFDRHKRQRSRSPERSNSTSRRRY
jgi:U1 small nuclear ribonucleoprotein 70kDa